MSHFLTMKQETLKSEPNIQKKKTKTSKPSVSHKEMTKITKNPDLIELINWKTAHEANISST